MIKTFSKLLAVCAVALWSTLAARAAILSGTYTNLDMQQYVSLWDITGEYTGDFTGLGSGDFTVAEDASGKYTGSGTLYVGSYDITGDITVSGDVRGSSKKPSMSMKLDFSATDFSVQGYYFKSLTAVLNGTFSFDFNDAELIGRGTASAKAVYQKPSGTKYFTRSVSAPFKDSALPMVSDMTGQWSLVWAVTSDGAKYTGSAAIVTTSGLEVDFTVTGTYSAVTDKSILKLKGPEGSDAELTLDITDSTQTIDSIEGKVLGQTLSYKSK